MPSNGRWDLIWRLKVNVQEVECESMGWIELAQDSDR